MTELHYYHPAEGDPGGECTKCAMGHHAEPMPVGATWDNVVGAAPVPTMRAFPTGATRNVDTNRLDYEGFLSPLVLRRFAEYMHKHRRQADGTLRASDNWQRGIPLDAYMKSGWRHFFEWWHAHRTGIVVEDALCALLFNAMGYLHEMLKARGVK